MSGNFFQQDSIDVLGLVTMGLGTSTNSLFVTLNPAGVETGDQVGGVGSVVERRSLADVLSLSCARPAANG